MDAITFKLAKRDGEMKNKIHTAFPWRRNEVITVNNEREFMEGFPGGNNAGGVFLAEPLSTDCGVRG